MSARISGVKEAESKAASLVRGLPLSQVQSAKAKGTSGCGVVGDGMVAVDATVALTGVFSGEGDGAGGVVDGYLSASSFSMRRCSSTTNLRSSTTSGSVPEGDVDCAAAEWMFNKNNRHRASVLTQWPLAEW